jgi:hypothetical protein
MSDGRSASTLCKSYAIDSACARERERKKKKQIPADTGTLRRVILANWFGVIHLFGVSRVVANRTGYRVSAPCRVSDIK